MQSHSLSPVSQNRLFIWILILGTFLLYAPTLFFQFIYFDDNEYIYENSRLQAGLSLSFVKWAFTTFYFANWHPLTWLSYGLDWQLYRFWAGGYHLTNVIFHVINALLVFLLFLKMTKSSAKSFLIAALFAWHPVRVESVAWIAERKDVLSTFFILLSMLSYVASHFTLHTKNLSSPRISHLGLISLLFFALSLMSKGMYVTLPIILMLFDFWPLNR